MRLAGIIDARLHHPRHFFAAVLISAGCDIEAVTYNYRSLTER